MKGKSYEADNWKICGQEFSVNDILVAIKDRPPSFIQDKLEDNQEDYFSLTNEDWCDLLSTIKVKDNRKREATQFKNIASDRVAYNSDRDGYVRVTRKKKEIIGVL